MGLNTINHPGQRLITALTATGTTNLTAFPLVGGTAFHEFTTTASGTGAILPSSRLPITVTISNAGASTLSIYPPVGGTIDGGSVDAAVSLATLTSATYWAAGPLTWYSTTTAATGAGTGTVTSASVTTAHGVSATVATATTTPAFTFTLGAITPTTIVASSTIAGSNLSLGGTLTTGGAVTVSGAFTTTLTVTANTSVTLPVSGTLLGTAAAVTAAQGGTGLATLTAHAVMVGAGTSNVAFATVGTTGRPLIDQGASADPAFLATGVKIDSSFGAITTDTVSATAVTCNLATSNKHNIVLVTGTTTTISLSNPTVGQVFRIKLIQDGTGSGLATFFTTIKWAGGTTPTLTATASKADVFAFECTGSNTYDGYIVGQNL